MVATKDGKIFVGGYFDSNSLLIGKNELLNNGSTDGMLIKYDIEGEVEWATSIGGNDEDQINSIVETSDDGVIVGGFFTGTVTIGDYTVNGYNSYNSDGNDNKI